jgi:hypothetical protein
MFLVVAFGGYYVWQSEMSPDPEAKGEAVPMFGDIEAVDLETISLELDGRSFTIMRVGSGKGAHWEFNEPAGALAEKAEIDNFAYLLSSMRKNHVLSREELGEDLEPFGLAVPKLILKFKTSKHSVKLAVGAKHSFSERRYVMIDEGDKIVMIDSSSIEGLFKSAFDVRDKTPFDLDVGKITSIEAKRGSYDTVEFVKSSDDSWQIRTLEQMTRADSNLITRALRTIRQGEVAEIVDVPSADRSIYGLDKPRLSVSLKSKDGAVFSFVAGEVEDGDKKKYFVSIEGDPRVYRYEQQFYGVFFQPSYYFRDKAPFAGLPFDKLAVVKFSSFSDIDNEYSIAKIERDEFGLVWGISNIAGQREVAEKAIVSEWLRELLGLRVISYASPGSLSLKATGKPEASIQMLFKLSEENTASYLLTISGPVASGNASEEDSDELAPRYGVISGALGNNPIPIIVSGAAWESLNKSFADFVVKTNDVEPATEAPEA